MARSLKSNTYLRLLLCDQLHIAAYDATAPSPRHPDEIVPRRESFPTLQLYLTECLVSDAATAQLQLPIFASANRDEEGFDELFSFKIERRPNRHLARRSSALLDRLLYGPCTACW